MTAFPVPFDPSLAFVGRILLLLVFARALFGKLRHRDEFVGVIANYRLTPTAWAAAAAWLVIALEAAVVLSLATGLALIGGAALAIISLCGFAVAMTINIVRGRTDIDCGCFRSALRQHLSYVLVARNALLAAVALTLLGPRSHSLSLLQMFDGIGAGIVLFILSQTLEQLQAVRVAALSMRKRYA